MADRTGLEPATPGVTGRYSNQLNYRSATLAMSSQQLFDEDELFGSHSATTWLQPSNSALLKTLLKKWWVMRDLNPRHSPCKGDALPTELITRVTERAAFYRLSGVCQQDVCNERNKTVLVFCVTK